MIGPWSFAVIVTGAAQATLAQLGATPEAGVDVNRVRFCPLVHGNIAWDNCDCGGQLAFSILEIVPTSRYPIDGSNESAQGGCEPPGLMALCLAVWNRCHPNLADAGTAPTCPQLYAAALLSQAAQYAMRTAITTYLCTQRSSRPQGIFDFRVGRGAFTGPEGNCASVEIPFSFLLR